MLSHEFIRETENHDVALNATSAKKKSAKEFDDCLSSFLEAKIVIKPIIISTIINANIIHPKIFVSHVRGYISFSSCINFLFKPLSPSRSLLLLSTVFIHFVVFS